MKFRLLYFILTLFPCGGVFAEVLFQSIPYQQGIFGYDTFRIPSLQVAADGTLLAFAEGRVDSAADNGNIDLVLRRSFDNGQTWQDLQVVWSDGDNTCGNPTPVLDETNGRIWLFMSHNLGQDTSQELINGTSDGYRTIWSCYSDDNGLSWSLPYCHWPAISSPWYVQPNNRTDGTGPGNGIQLKQGAGAGRLVIPAHLRNVQSDDHGQTWYESSLVDSRGGNESSVVEIANGALLRNDRAGWPNSQENYRVLNRSYNQGVSWTGYQKQYDLITPICQGSCIGCYAESNERYLLFSNPAALTRIRLSVKCSVDDGNSWSNGKLIYRPESAYSSLAQISDDLVGLLYENGDGWAYHRITFARFSFGWLKDESVFSWDFEDCLPGTGISTTSGSVKDVRGYGLNGSSKASFEIISGSSLYGGQSAVRFSGSGEGLKISDSDSRDILDFDSEDSFAIRVVFRTLSHDDEGYSSAGALVAKDVDSSEPSWWLRVQGGKLCFFVDDGTVSSSAWSDEKVNNGAWCEALAVRDAVQNKLELYVNGRLCGQSEDNTSGSFANDNDVYIGCFNSGLRSFVGDVDKVQIYRGVRDDIILHQDGDLTNDGVVDIDDLVVIFNNWLSS